VRKKWRWGGGGWRESQSGGTEKNKIVITDWLEKWQKRSPLGKSWFVGIKHEVTDSLGKEK